MAERRLARLRAALAEHNWLSVAIEIGIVALGVLLAFQVQQWGEERARVTDEHQFLERLYGEYGRAGDEMKRLVTDHDKVVNDIGLAFANRGNPSQLAIYARTPEFGCSLARFRDATFNDTSFEELVASGRINVISDPDLRAEIRDLAAAQAASARQIDSSRMLMMGQLDTLDNFYQFEMDGGKPSCTIDWLRMLNDRKATNAAIRAYRVNAFSRDARQTVIDRIAHLRGKLACTLGKPECHN